MLLANHVLWPKHIYGPCAARPLPRISSTPSKHPRRTQPRVAELGEDKGIFTHNRYMVSEGQHRLLAVG